MTAVVARPTQKVAPLWLVQARQRSRVILRNLEAASIKYQSIPTVEEVRRQIAQRVPPVTIEQELKIRSGKLYLAILDEYEKKKRGDPNQMEALVAERADLLKQLKIQNGEALQELKASKDSVDQQAKEVIRQETDLTIARARQTELETKHASIQVANQAQIETSRTQLAAKQKALDESTERTAEAKREADTLRADLRSAKGDMTRLGEEKRRLVASLRGQLATNQQAARERLEEVEEQLRDATQEVDDMRIDLKNAADRVQELVDQVDDLTAAKIAAEVLVKDVQGKLADSARELKVSQDALKTKEAAVKQLGIDLEAEKKKVAAQTAEVSRLSVDLAKTKADLLDETDRADRLEAERDLLETQNDGLEKDLLQAGEAAEQLATENATLSTKVGSLTTTNNTLRLSVKSLEDRQKEIQIELGTAQTDRTTALGKLAAVNRDLKEKNDKIKENEDRIEGLEYQIRQRDKSINRLNEEVTGLKETISEQAATIRTKDVEIGKLKIEIDDAKIANIALQDEVKKVKESMVKTEQELTAARVTITGLEKANKDLGEDLKTERLTSSGLKTKLDKLQITYDALVLTEGRTAAENETLKKQTKDLKAQIQAEKSKIKQLEASILEKEQEHKEAVTKLTTTITDQTKQIGTLTKRLSQAITDKTKAEAQNLRLQEDVTKQKGMITSLTNQRDVAQSALDKNMSAQAQAEEVRRKAEEERQEAAFAMQKQLEYYRKLTAIDLTESGYKKKVTALNREYRRYLKGDPSATLEAANARYADAVLEIKSLRLARDSIEEERKGLEQNIEKANNVMAKRAQEALNNGLSKEFGLNGLIHQLMEFVPEEQRGRLNERLNRQLGSVYASYRDDGLVQVMSGLGNRARAAGQRRRKDEKETAETGKTRGPRMTNLARDQIRAQRAAKRK